MIDEIPGDLFQWFRGFYFVAKQGSVTSAAGIMGREQPTVSRQIKCLEKELGVTLFDRSSGKMVLTQEGKIVQQKVVSIFEDIKEIRKEFREEGKKYTGKIVISATHTIIDSFLPQYVINFIKAHPMVTFQLNEALVDVIIEKVESGEADLGICFNNSLSPAVVVSYDLFKTRTVLIAPKDHLFFTRDNPTLEEISRCPLILFSQSGSLEHYIEDSFAKKKLKMNVLITHNSIEAIKKYVRLGLGITIAASNVVTKEDEEKFQVIPLDKYFQDRTYSLFLRRKRYRSPALESFIRTIKTDIVFS
jgi:DNA-binding transcriptional LysR family regulator